MNKIIVLQGVPCSGKSTWAREFAKEHKDYVIVNRDNIREGTGIYWVPEREKYISEIETTSVLSALKNNLNVIIDATNLNPKTITKWTTLAHTQNAEIEFKEFKVSYEEAVRRDFERGEAGGRSVGETVVRRFFKDYYPDEMKKKDNRFIRPYDDTKQDVIICDIDGTVALCNGRNIYDLSKVNEDTFDPRMLRLLKYLSKDLPIIFVSGREGTDECMEVTKEWITKNFMPGAHGINWDIIFRKKGDYRNDAIVKEEIFKEKINPYYNVICVFDDRDRVVKMWRDNGILCSQVYYGDF